MAGALLSAGSDHWSSPRPLFDTLHARFDFTIDGAASHDMAIQVKQKDETFREVQAPANNLLPRWWGPGGVVEDALGIDWTGERPFFNPPFSMVDAFLMYAKRQCRDNGVLSVFLIKHQSDKAIWVGAVADGAAQIGTVAGRLSYGRPEGPSVGATFASCIIVFDPYWPEGLPPVTYPIDRTGHYIAPVPYVQLG